MLATPFTLVTAVTDDKLGLPLWIVDIEKVTVSPTITLSFRSYTVAVMFDEPVSFTWSGAADTTIELAIARVTTYTGVRWEEPKWLAPWETAEDHEVVQRALSGLEGAGLAPRLASYQFCTNGAYSAGTAGVPTIGFGPSTEAHAHVVDEYVEVEDLLAAYAGYRGIVAALLR